MNLSVDIISDELVSYNLTGSFTNSSTFTSIRINKAILYQGPLQKDFIPYIIIDFVIWAGIFSIPLIFAYILPKNLLVSISKFKKTS